MVNSKRFSVKNGSFYFPSCPSVFNKLIQKTIQWDLRSNNQEPAHQRVIGSTELTSMTVFIPFLPLLQCRRY